MLDLDNASGGSDSGDGFFDTSFPVERNDGGDVSGTGSGGGSGDNAGQAGAGQNAQGGQQQGKLGGGDQGANAEPPMGFEKQFFNDTGDFDADGALNFITSSAPEGYNSVQDIVSTMRNPIAQQQPVQPQGGPQKEPWEEDYEKDRVARENHFKPYTMFRDFLKTAINEGFQGAEAMRRAEQLANEAAERDWGRIQYKTKFERDQETRKKMEEERSFSELIPKSRTNLGVVYTKFKNGEKGFNSLMFGEDIKDAQGKVIGKSKGFGIDAVNYAFKLQNSGKELPKDPAELKKYCEDWWIRFTSEPQNIEHLMDFALSRLNLHLQKFSAAQLRKQGAQQQKNMTASQTNGNRSGKQRNHNPSDPGGAGQGFSGKVMQSKDFIDSV